MYYHFCNIVKAKTKIARKGPSDVIVPGSDGDLEASDYITWSFRPLIHVCRCNREVGVHS